MGSAMYRCLALLALVACGGPGAKPASADASTSRPPTSSDDAAVDASTTVDFIETFSPGSHDTGHWILTTSSMRVRMIDATGGNPGGYLYGEVATSIPTWYTESTRYAPGNNDSTKRDSVFVGDYANAGITHLSADLDILQVGTWTSDRTLTIELRRWDPANDVAGLTADYSLPAIPSPPVGWNHYDFMIDAQATAIPPGWTVTRGDGSPGIDADWAVLMHQVDFAGLGYGKPSTGYPNMGTWNLGIDNVHITAQ